MSDGNEITPEEAWKRYNGVLGYVSSGVLAVSVAECQSCALTVHSAPDLPLQPDHMEIDFSDLKTSGEVDRAAKKLCTKANARGWKYFAW